MLNKQHITAYICNVFFKDTSVVHVIVTYMKYILIEMHEVMYRWKKGCNKISTKYSFVCFFLYKQKLHGSIYVKFTIFQNHVTWKTPPKLKCVIMELEHRNKNLLMRNLKLKTQTKYVRFLTKKERMEVSMWYSNEWVHMEGKQVEVKGNDSLHQKMYISNNNIVIYDISFFFTISWYNNIFIWFNKYSLRVARCKLKFKPCDITLE